MKLFRNKKTLTVIATYTAAVIIALGICAGVFYSNLKKYRLAVNFSSEQALEETVAAVSTLTETLGKTPYATDRDMCARLCSEVYADALSAEAALSTLPFSTQELEQICAYLNQTGDYAYTLCTSVAEDGFTDSERENLTKLSALSSKLNEALSSIRQDYRSGSIDMDSRELILRNVALERKDKVSSGILQAEADFPQRDALSYDGKYSFKPQKEKASYTSDAQMLAAAARFAGVSPGQLRLEYSYEDGSGCKAYSTGDRQICVAPQGVISMSQTRLVKEGKISVEDAEKNAAAFLEDMGFENLVLSEKERSDTIARFVYNVSEDDALWLDNIIQVAVALDDGSIYSFNGEKYTDEPSGVKWEITEVEAAGAVPDNLEVSSGRRIIRETPGGKLSACYEFECTNKKGDGFRIHVNAATGKQAEIIAL